MPALFLKPGSFDGWYIVKRRDGGRVSDADVEGTAAEMLELARAITDRSSASFKRCAVKVQKHYVSLWSPRNSQRPARVGIGDADALATDIIAKLQLAREHR